MTDTIAAIATAKGKGAIGVVKISGPKAASIAQVIVQRKLTPRSAHYLGFYDAGKQLLDQGIALYFAAPDSYTGEDVLELQAHGNPHVLDDLLNVALGCGARNARPGEFTERAFLNDKIDLAQAEAVADLIESNSRAAARAAVRSMSGDFSARIGDISLRLVNLRVYIEAALDFAEEEIDFLAEETLTVGLQELDELIANTLHRATEGSVLREGLNVVIVGEPNVGKSSLLNALTEQDTAIVTDIAGTTRDVLREQIVINGLPVYLIDTAGLRETSDIVEREGVRRAMQQVENADLILIIGIAGVPEIDVILSQSSEHIEILRIYNKADLAPAAQHADGMLVSAKTGQGIDQLKDAITRYAGLEQSPEGAFMARRRHLNALENVQQHVQTARTHLLDNAAGELAAEELRNAQQQLNLVTGEFSADDLLGEIFGRFCIGK